MSNLISEDELSSALKKLPEWEQEGAAIIRSIEFEDFMEAIDFVNLVAEVAEESHHHPEIDIRFVKVDLRLTSHDVGGVTDLDLEMANRIDNLAD